MDLHAFEVCLLGSSRVATLGSLAALVLLGVSSHRLYFIKGEHHMKAPHYFLSWVSVSAFIYGLTFIAESRARAESTQRCASGPVVTTSLLNIAFFVPLFTSMILYRVFEHPLRNFPGPRMAAVSKLWHFFYAFGKQNHLLLEDLRTTYGPFVRTGMCLHLCSSYKLFN